MSEKRLDPEKQQMFSADPVKKAESQKIGAEFYPTDGSISIRHTLNVNGIGCFAESATLYRMFRKTLEKFILRKHAHVCSAAEWMAQEQNLTRLFRSVIAFGTEKPDHIDRALKSVRASAKITGFFLGLNKHALHLVVFFLDDRYQRAKFIVRLEALT